MVHIVAKDIYGKLGAKIDKIKLQLIIEGLC